MNRKSPLIITGAVVAAGIGWSLFRPELLFVNQRVNEGLPTVQAASARADTPLAAGRFKTGAHKTEGAATVHALGERRVLRLTDFETSNGPDVRVYLVAAPDVKDNADVKKSGFIDLGALKGNQGDQNYDIPAGADLGRYRAVTIWCRRFGVNFGTAPLMTAAETGGSGVQMSLAEGRFRGLAHGTEGDARIYQLADGKRIVRLSGFKTSNGPDVRVYLVRAADAPDNATVKKAGFVDLGALKGNEGDQNYELPNEVDLTRYGALTIWCRRFGVNFGTAALKAQG
jgi:hypothetical protein